MTVKNIVISSLFLIIAVFSVVSATSAAANNKELPVPQDLEIIG